MVGVRSLGTGFDFDESGEDRAGFVVEGVEVKEVTGSVRSDMILQGALVDLAGSFDGIDGIHLAARSSPTRRLRLSPRTNPPPKLAMSAVQVALLSTEVEFRWKAVVSRDQS